MGKAFYRKYRSKSLSEVIGQAHITDALTTALKNNAVSHAYLFTGPRGVGKTSVARILAHEINELPYAEGETTHLDIIEIDAASNRRIDEIRDLKDKVHIAPTSTKYKVYIIDEVHMLTKEAFNALLKTLEEPPAHVVFILATTEAHKLPETIISRTQRYTFKPVDQTAVIAHLAAIAKKESIDIDAKALELIAAHGEGSFRDSISLLDQMRHSSKMVVLEDVERALGIAPTQLVEQTLEALSQSNRAKVEESLHSIHEVGVDIVQFAGQLAARLRLKLKDQPEIRQADLVLLDELARIGAQPQPHIALTLALYRPLAVATPVTAALQVQTQPTAAEPPSEVLTPEIVEPQDAEYFPQENELELPPEPVMTSATSTEDTATWNGVLAALKLRHNTLYGVVRMAQPDISESTVTLSFSFPFHVRRISDEKNRRVIETVIQETLGKPLKVIAVKSEVKQTAPKPKAVPVAQKRSSDHVSSVSNIFGGAEIVES